MQWQQRAAQRTRIRADAARQQRRRGLQAFPVVGLERLLGAGDQIGQQVAQNDGNGRYKRHAHDDRNVDTLDGLPCQLPDTGPAEHGFHHHDPAHENADIDADHGDDGQNRILAIDITLEGFE